MKGDIWVRFLGAGYAEQKGNAFLVKDLVVKEWITFLIIVTIIIICQIDSKPFPYFILLLTEYFIFYYFSDPRISLLSFAFNIIHYIL